MKKQIIYTLAASFSTTKTNFEFSVTNSRVQLCEKVRGGGGGVVHEDLKLMSCTSVLK